MIKTKWAARLFFLTAVVWMLAAVVHPQHTAVYVCIGVVFLIIGLSQQRASAGKGEPR